MRKPPPPGHIVRMVTAAAFLAPNLYVVRNLSRASNLGVHIMLAGSSRARREGLIARQTLEFGSGLWIDPCEAIHTFNMKFAIDVVFLDGRLKVLKVCSGVRPHRIRVCWRATSVLELPAGTAAATETRRGDVLVVERSAAR